MRQSKRCWVQLRMLNQSVLSWKLLSGGCSCHALYYISEILLLRLVLLLSIAGQPPANGNVPVHATCAAVTVAKRQLSGS